MKTPHCNKKSHSCSGWIKHDLLKLWYLINFSINNPNWFCSGNQDRIRRWRNYTKGEHSGLARRSTQWHHLQSTSIEVNQDEKGGVICEGEKHNKGHSETSSSSSPKPAHSVFPSDPSNSSVWPTWWIPNRSDGVPWPLPIEMQKLIPIL